jgi:hypothetical protein
MLWGWRRARGAGLSLSVSRQRQGPETGARDRGQRQGPETGARDRGQRQGDVTAIRFCLRSPMVGGLEWGTMVALARDALGMVPVAGDIAIPAMQSNQGKRCPANALPLLLRAVGAGNAMAPVYRTGGGAVTSKVRSPAPYFAPPLGKTMLAHRLAMAQVERASMLAHAGGGGTRASNTGVAFGPKAKPPGSASQLPNRQRKAK